MDEAPNQATAALREPPFRLAFLPVHPARNIRLFR